MIEVQGDQVFINGEFFENVSCSEYLSENATRYFASTAEASKRLAELTIQEFVPFFSIELRELFDWSDWRSRVTIFRASYDKGAVKSLSIELLFFPEVREWNKSYSISDYFEIFYKVWEVSKVDIDLRSLEGGTVLCLYYEIPFPKSSIRDFISDCENSLKAAHKRTLEIIEASNQFITFQFNFPDELKAACEHYLLYFAQFLRDLGINTTSNLKEEEAGKVLFSVTPTDDIEALDKIREALALYLSLPSSPIVYDESFKAMRLEQQIRNLEHSQRMAETEIRSTQYALRLAQQNIENQDKIIIQQDSFIEQQNRVIEKITSKSVMIDSLENKEEIFDGLKVGESEFLAKQVGVHFNPVTFVKNIGKKFLGKDDDIISILDSDEETDKK